ncbi:MAG: RagB/SusD family nutrient uptake outer membrane protein [Bacteroidales bacterium]|nr:RagB/SusD family nutrient uptake outer membrane protein [Bacteroidales bacterium]
MKHITKKIALILAGMVFIFTSCLNDLDRFPINDITGDDVYTDVMGFRMALARVYGTLTLTGQQGPAGQSDIAGMDEGFSGFTRTFWNVQTLPTDEAFDNWGDDGLPALNSIEFDATNPFSGALYNRSILNILFANHFMRQSDPSNLGGFSDADRAEIAVMRAEARFIRAFQYWVLMDVFANPPFIDETMPFGTIPSQKHEDANTGRAMLFSWIESELLYLADNGLRPAGTNERGRVCQAAAWALLARIYLNANVYTSPVGNPGNNTQFYTSAIEFANRVISSGVFSLHSNYEHLFLNDNQDSPEMIWGLFFHGVHARTFSGVTFLINVASNSEHQVNHRAELLHYGMFLNANWAGSRVRGQFVNLFDRDNDRRFLFVGPSTSIGANTDNFALSGMATFKFRNIPSRMVVQGCERTLDTTGSFYAHGTPGACTVCGPNEGCFLFQRYMDEERPFGNDPQREFADNTFPLFRLAEMFLIYAEAIERGGSGGNRGAAIANLNELQARAGLPNISNFDLNWIIDERGRELFWEGHRRTDLVRFNRFTSGPSWEWRGGIPAGTTVLSHFNIYPIPFNDIMANQNLRQNPGFEL